jgi:hypothetical protein
MHAGNRRGASYLSAGARDRPLRWIMRSRSRSLEGAAMIYILAVFLPPLGLLLNGQPFSAIFNLVLIPICLLLGLIFPSCGWCRRCTP